MKERPVSVWAGWSQSHLWHDSLFTLNSALNSTATLFLCVLAVNPNHTRYGSLPLYLETWKCLTSCRAGTCWDREQGCVVRYVRVLCISFKIQNTGSSKRWMLQVKDKKSIWLYQIKIIREKSWWKCFWSGWRSKGKIVEESEAQEDRIGLVEGRHGVDTQTSGQRGSAGGSFYICAWQSIVICIASNIHDVRGSQKACILLTIHDPVATYTSHCNLPCNMGETLEENEVK